MLCSKSLWQKQKQKSCFSKDVNTYLCLTSGSPCGASGKEPILKMKETEEMWVLSLDGEDPLEEGMAVTPVLLPGESHR